MPWIQDTAVPVGGLPLPMRFVYLGFGVDAIQTSSPDKFVKFVVRKFVTSLAGRTTGLLLMALFILFILTDLLLPTGSSFCGVLSSTRARSVYLPITNPLRSYELRIYRI